MMIKDLPKDEENQNPTKLKYQEVINPIILEKSKETNRDFEGCLSIPHYVGVVSRHTQIKVQFQDQKGQLHQKILQDYMARIFQHEFDHLEGILYLDRMETTKDLVHDDEFEAMEWMDLEKILHKK